MSKRTPTLYQCTYLCHRPQDVEIESDAVAQRGCHRWIDMCVYVVVRWCVVARWWLRREHFVLRMPSHVSSCRQGAAGRRVVRSSPVPPLRTTVARSCYTRMNTRAMHGWRYVTPTYPYRRWWWRIPAHGPPATWFSRRSPSLSQCQAAPTDGPDSLMVVGRCMREGGSRSRSERGASVRSPLPPLNPARVRLPR